MNYLISKVTVDELMTREVITIIEDTPLEETARIMADKKIGGLSVVRDNKGVGIITETDLFKIFLEMLGATEPGVRLAVLVPDVPEALSQLSKVIYDIGGHIVEMGTFLGESSENREVTMKMYGVDGQSLRDAIEPFIEQIVNIRESTLG